MCIYIYIWDKWKTSLPRKESNQVHLASGIWMCNFLEQRNGFVGAAQSRSHVLNMLPNRVCCVATSNPFCSHLIAPSYLCLCICFLYNKISNIHIFTLRDPKTLHGIMLYVGSCRTSQVYVDFHCKVRSDELLVRWKGYFTSSFNDSNGEWSFFVEGQIPISVAHAMKPLCVTYSVHFSSEVR